MPVLAVDGNKEFRFQKSMKYFEFFLTGVPRNVNFFYRLIHHFRAHAVEIVYNLIYILFVPRNRRRGNNYSVVRAYLYLIVIARRHTSQRAHRLALTSRRYYNEIFIRDVLYLRYIDRYVFRYVHFPYLYCRLDDVQHTSARKRNLSLVFDSEIDTRRKTLTPNAIRISPVLRQDITKIIPVAPSVSAAIGIPQQGQTEPAPLSGAGGQEALAGAPDPQDPESRELTLLRKKLCELFASRYIEVRVELKGSSPESQTIPLSSFYEKQGIERGHLKGSWSLFEKSIRKEILDSGIVKKARDAVLDELSVSIPTYGRIIRAGDLEELRAKMEQIAKDYQAYLTGNENCKKVGTLKVEKHFSPADAISESFSKLEAYLYRIGNDLNKGGRYYDAVSEFLNKKRPDPNAFSERVELQLTSSTYTESQWGSRDFLRRFDSAIAESLAVKKTFFDQEIIALTKRCLMLLEEQG